MKRKLKKTLRVLLTTSNLFVFIAFVVTAFVMYHYVGDKTVGTTILFSVFLFLLFNKVDSIDRRLKILEGR